jgi:hypothetical protein
VLPVVADFSSLVSGYPWKDIFLVLITVGMIVALVYFFRPVNTAGKHSFTIFVDEDDITFDGNFPPHMQETVAAFLRNDCGIEGAYQVKGHWDFEENGTKRLIVTTKGDAAKPLEQRIRNFLKLNLKPPRPE